VRAAYEVTQRSWVGVETLLVLMASLLGSADRDVATGPRYLSKCFNLVCGTKGGHEI
jgi:hypothetical protein